MTETAPGQTKHPVSDSITSTNPGHPNGINSGEIIRPIPPVRDQGLAYLARPDNESFPVEIAHSDRIERIVA